MKNNPHNSFKNTPNLKKEGAPQRSSSTTQLLARIALYRHVSLLKHHSFGNQVARIDFDYETSDDHESARADARGLAEDDALGDSFGSVALHVGHGFE